MVQTDLASAEINLNVSRHIIDELLEERTETLRKLPLLWGFIRSFCYPFFKYQQAVDWADRLHDEDGRKALRTFSEFLALKLSVEGLENIPKTGPLLIVANHPTGFVDAFAIHEAISKVRSDTVFFSNKDVMRIVPTTSDIVIPIEWMKHRRTKQAMRETLVATHKYIEEGCAIVVFPAGGIARGSLGGLKELDWQPTVLKLMKRFDVPVLPLNIRARNSMLYYLFEQIHDELRDLLRFREVLGKAGRKFDIKVGRVIKPEDIDIASVETTRQMQRHVVSGFEDDHRQA